MRELVLVVVFGVPVVGLLMGGVYSIPASRLTGARDPWLTVLLGLGLGVTVVGGGTLMSGGVPLRGGSASALAWVFAGSIALLLAARRVYGHLGHSVERFGLVHAATLLATGIVSTARRGG